MNARCAGLVALYLVACALAGASWALGQEDRPLRIALVRSEFIQVEVVEMEAPGASLSERGRATIRSAAETMIRVEWADRAREAPEGAPAPTPSEDEFHAAVRLREEALLAERAGPPEVRQAVRRDLRLHFRGTLPEGTPMEVRVLGWLGGADLCATARCAWARGGEAEALFEGFPGGMGGVRIECVAALPGPEAGGARLMAWTDLLGPEVPAAGASADAPFGTYRALAVAFASLRRAHDAVRAAFDGAGGDAPPPRIDAAAVARLLEPVALPAEGRWSEACAALLEARRALGEAWDLRFPRHRLASADGSGVEPGAPPPPDLNPLTRLDAASQALDGLAREWSLAELPDADDVRTWVAEAERLARDLSRMEGESREGPAAAYTWRVGARRWVREARVLEKGLPGIGYVAVSLERPGLADSCERLLRELARREAWLSLRADGAGMLLDVEGALAFSEEVWGGLRASVDEALAAR